MSDTQTDTPKFAIFRGAEAVDFEQSGIMSSVPPTETEAEGAGRAVAAGMAGGADNQLLFSAPGISLARIWFKSGFPLPRHSHDTNCLYYILAGSLRLGREELGPGDGFLVGADVPYAYTPGEDGVELLEFRSSNSFDIKLLANNPAFWQRATETSADRSAQWQEERRPSERA